MSDAQIGYGSAFGIDLAGGTNYVDLAEVFSITPPNDSLDIVDVTHMGSPNRTREFITGLNDPGTCSFEMNFVPGSASDDLIQAVKSAGTVVACRITFGSGAIWTFDGLLTGYAPAVPNEDKMTATVTFKVTGSYVSEYS